MKGYLCVPSVEADIVIQRRFVLIIVFPCMTLLTECISSNCTSVLVYKTRDTLVALCPALISMTKEYMRTLVAVCHKDI